MNLEHRAELGIENKLIMRISANSPLDNGIGGGIQPTESILSPEQIAEKIGQYPLLAKYMGAHADQKVFLDTLDGIRGVLGISKDEQAEAVKQQIQPIARKYNALESESGIFFLSSDQFSAVMIEYFEEFEREKASNEINANEQTEVIERGLSIKPRFSEEERMEIATLWANERMQKSERLKALQQEEERVQRILVTDHAKELIDIYDSFSYRAYQGMPSKYIVSKDDVITLLRHAIPNVVLVEKDIIEESKLKDAVSHIGKEETRKAKLDGVINIHFSSRYAALIAAYPALDIQPFEFDVTPRGYWYGNEGKERIIAAVKWLIEDHPGIPKEDPDHFREYLTSLNFEKILWKFSLIVGVNQAGYRPISNIMSDAYPELKFKPWDFKGGAKWNTQEGSMVIEDAVRWLVEERFGLSPVNPDFKHKLVLIRARDFNNFGLSGLLNKRSHFRLLQQVYGNLAPADHELSRFPSGFWKTEDARIKAISYIRTLVGDQISISADDPNFRKQVALITSEQIDRGGLGGMLAIIFKNSVSEAIIAAFPELNLKRWEFSSVPHHFWTKDDYKGLKEAIKWVVEDRLEIDPRDPRFKELVIQKLRRSVIRENGLESVFLVSGLSTFQIVQHAYPELEITEEEYGRQWTTKRGKEVVTKAISPDDATDALLKYIQEDTV